MPKTNYKELNLQTFSGEIGDYKVVKTDDNSQTLWSEYFDECCHSTDGAIEETLYNYIEGTHVLEKLEAKKSINIFEIGFATGIGAKVTFDTLSQSQPSLNFVSCELDKGLVCWAIENTKCELIQSLKLKDSGDLEYFESENKDQKLIVLIGDARVSIPLAINSQLITKFDCFYQDPFSPKKNPTLWTKQWFELMKSIAHPNAYLSTYSASTSVRKAMDAAGWGVFNRKGFHGKRASTYAIMGEQTQLEVREKLNQSSVLPLTDEQLENE